MRKLTSRSFTLTFLFICINLVLSAQNSFNPFRIKLFKPKVEVVYADWCPHCTDLRTKTLADQSLLHDLGEKYELRLLNSDSAEGQAVMREFGINGFPTILVFDESGSLAKTIQGYRTVPEFRADLALPVVSASHKPVVSLVYADWCPHCTELRTTTLSDQSLLHDLGEKYELRQLNSESPEGKATMQQFGINAFPTILVFNETGELSRTLQGYKTVKEFRAEFSLPDVPGEIKTETTAENKTAVQQPAAPVHFGPVQISTGDAGFMQNQRIGLTWRTEFLCTAGTYESSPGVCTTCPAGSYCVGGNPAPAPVSCPAGNYCPAGASAPSVCPAGFYCPASSPSPVACVAGTYSSAAGATSVATCTACAGGTYSTTTAATSSSTCIACTAGNYCPAGSSSLTQCTAGNYCPAGSAAPTACPAGTYSGVTGAFSPTTCTACPAGKYSTTTAATTSAACISCPGGTYNTVSGANSATFCLSCTAGNYCPTGSAVQTLCPSGYYCPANSSSPAACPAGTYNGSAGATSSIFCTSCIAGTYSTTTAATTSAACIACAAGTYSTTSGASSSSTCVNCTAGNYCPSGSSSQTTCPAGYYCPAGSSSPSACPAGTYSSATAASSPFTCTACAAGTYSTTNAATSVASCVSCPAGTYSTTTGANSASACVSCLAGNYCPAGSSSVTPCPAGSYCPANSASPTTCPAGSYCPANSSSPTVCPAGSYCPAGSISAQNCPAGTYNTSAGGTNLSACTSCLGGTYSTTVGATSSSTCLACPAGSYCPAGSGSAVICPGGSYCPAGSSSNTICPAGFYCPAGSINPVICPAGAYCPAGSATFSDYNNVGIGTTAPDGSAVLELASTSKGLLIPRMDSASRAGILAPANSLLVYQTDKDFGVYQFTTNKGWQKLGATLKKTETVSIPAVTAGSVYAVTLTLSGAETGSSVAVSPDVTLPAELVIAFSRVTAANTVEIMLKNVSSGSASAPKTVNFYVTIVK